MAAGCWRSQPGKPPPAPWPTAMKVLPWLRRWCIRVRPFGAVVEVSGRPLGRRKDFAPSSVACKTLGITLLRRQRGGSMLSLPVAAASKGQPVDARARRRRQTAALATCPAYDRWLSTPPLRRSPSLPSYCLFIRLPVPCCLPSASHSANSFATGTRGLCLLRGQWRALVAAATAAAAAAAAAACVLLRHVASVCALSRCLLPAAALQR
jgi:hypothetical protein